MQKISSRNTLRIAAASCLTAGVLAVTACGGGVSAGSTTPQPAAPTDHAVVDSARSLLPSAVASKGKLTIAVDATSAPDVMLAEDNKTITGWQTDTGRALADALGLEAEFVNTSTATIIPGIENGKYDLGMATFGITPERVKVIDFVGNFVGGIGFITSKDSNLEFNSIEDLCGLSVGVVQGTMQIDYAEKQSTQCIESGKPAVDIQQFPDKNQVGLALSSSRSKLAFLDGTMTGYMVKQDPEAYKTIGESIPLGAAGIQIPKGTGMAEAVRAALQSLMDDGTYKAILDSYGVGEGALTKATINDPDVR